LLLVVLGIFTIEGKNNACHSGAKCSTLLPNNSVLSTWRPRCRLSDSLTDLTALSVQLGAIVPSKSMLIVKQIEINEKVENDMSWEYAARNHYNKQLFDLVFVGETL